MTKEVAVSLTEYPYDIFHLFPSRFEATVALEYSEAKGYGGTREEALEDLKIAVADQRRRDADRESYRQAVDQSETTTIMVDFGEAW